MFPMIVLHGSSINVNMIIILTLLELIVTITIPHKQRKTFEYYLNGIYHKAAESKNSCPSHAEVMI